MFTVPREATNTTRAWGVRWRVKGGSLHSQKELGISEIVRTVPVRWGRRPEWRKTEISHLQDLIDARGSLHRPQDYRRTERTAELVALRLRLESRADSLGFSGNGSFSILSWGRGGTEEKPVCGTCAELSDWVLVTESAGLSKRKVAVLGHVWEASCCQPVAAW